MPFWVKLLLLGFGLVFTAVGVGVGFFGARSAQAEAARAAALAPLGARELEARPVGESVIVEGTLSTRNRSLFRDFVAYSVEEYRGEHDDDDGEPEWEAAGRETPPLLVEARGLVQVGNTNYSIGGRSVHWQDSESLYWNGLTGDGTKRYFGLVAGQPVTVVGTVAAGAEGNELHARVLYAGTQADYVQSQHEAAVVMPLIGLIFGLVGLITGGLGLWSVFRW